MRKDEIERRIKEQYYTIPLFKYNKNLIQLKYDYCVNNYQIVIEVGGGEGRYDYVYLSYSVPRQCYILHGDLMHSDYLINRLTCNKFIELFEKYNIINPDLQKEAVMDRFLNS